jgi:hypothetical protein
MASTHDLDVLPADFLVPEGDGAARLLAGMRLPFLPLAATDGTQADLTKLTGCTVVHIYSIFPPHESAAEVAGWLHASR